MSLHIIGVFILATSKSIIDIFSNNEGKTKIEDFNITPNNFDLSLMKPKYTEPVSWISFNIVCLYSFV